MSKGRSSHCLRPGCTHEARSRGLCKSCVALAHTLVRAGLTTWEALEKNGKAKPLRHGAIKSWFLEVAQKKAVGE